MRTVRTGHRGVFDDGNRRFVGAENDIAVRADLCEFRLVGFRVGLCRGGKAQGRYGAKEGGGRKSRESSATAKYHSRLLCRFAIRCWNVAPRRLSAKTHSCRGLHGGLMAKRSSAALDAREKTAERQSQFFLGDLGNGCGPLPRRR